MLGFLDLDLDFLKKDKYIVIFVKKVNGRYSKIGKKKADPTQPVVKFKGSTYPISYEHVMYRDGQKNYIMVDVDWSGNGDEANQEPSQNMLSQVSPQLLDAILSRGIVSQLVSRMSPASSNSFASSIAILAMALIAGVFIGYFLGSLFPIEYLQGIVGSQAGIGGGA